MFAQADYDQKWNFAQKFDLIHGRMLFGTTQSPQTLLKQAYDWLEPGGWLEMQDTVIPFRCDDNSIRGTAYEKWNLMVRNGGLKLGRDSTAATHYKEWMQALGFRNVVEVVYKWPQNPWPKDQKLREVGQWNLINLFEGIEGISARLLESIYGMKEEEVAHFLEEVKRDAKNPKIHAYWPM